ncbi:DNA polymerase III subunit alpha [Neobacillus sp. SM06]|uniref:DNA polymerase III subunit alpha n=1 Tax=Neobacillus sp. SM06 TaxID=3422492 RepID=UPI003D27FC4B
MSFIHLHVYSAYSLLSSTISIERLIENAKAMQFQALALTDRNVMYGAVEFYKSCKKKGMKPIIGLTADILSDLDHAEAFPLVLLAENDKGFQNLLKISSAIQTKAEKGIPEKWLKHYSQGLIAITPGLEGEIEQQVLMEKEIEAKNSIQKWLNFFGKENFYLSIQHHKLPQEERIRQKFVEFSQEMKVSLAATNQIYYLKQEDEFAHECLLAIKNGTKLQDEQRQRLGSDQFYLKSASEMAECLAEYPDALENTIRIANRCNVHIELNKSYLPRYPTENGKGADEFLEELCFNGLRGRVRLPNDQYVNRLHYELSVIKRMKFSDYFLIVWDFIRYARDNGILTGPGRGSAAGSLVAYVLEITDVDPIEHQLLFERFLNPERISMPDIDTDFPDNRRDEVIEYVAKKYGELHVAQIITFGTLAAKAALKDVGRAFGLNPKELDQLSKLVPSRLGITLSAALKESGKLRAYIDEDPVKRSLIETALKLEGLPRHTSTHAAGVVLSEKPLVELIPIQSGHSNVFLTQYSMEHLEEIGLLKMDFLGLRNLSLMDAVLRSVYQKTGKKLKIRSIPLDDQTTFALLSNGETTGVFQLESEGMRKVLKQLKPSRFEDIVAVNALYRPGPMENIPLFINRKHGREPVVYPHPDLKSILENTYGVIVYQEQIIQIASTMAGFTLGEADLLRRAVSKKKKDVLEQERRHFLAGALKKGYSEALANEVYDLIVRFANYGFNRSHAVAYSLIAYQLAYLKVHYPLHFMAALLTSAIGNEEKISQYIRELKQLDIRILPPSINGSGFSFRVENDGIRYSLAAIKGIGAAALKEIFQARNRKKFTDLFDFCIRVSTKAVNRKTLEALVHSGSLDEFGEDRAVLLASLDAAIEHAQLVKPNDATQVDFFADEGWFPKPKYTQVDPISTEDKLSFEKEVLGLYLSDHPISIFEKALKQSGAKELLTLSGRGTSAAVGVYIASMKRIRTKKGDSMAFLTISDSSGEMPAVVFPDIYRKHLVLLDQGSKVVVEGKTDERDGILQFIVQKVTRIEEWLEGKKNKDSILYLRIPIVRQTSDHLKLLQEWFLKNPGKTMVVLHYESGGKTVKLPKEFSIEPKEPFLRQLKDFLGDGNVILAD